MKKLIIIHGSGGASDDHWFPYIKNNLEPEGWEVHVPQFPGGGSPVLSEWLTTADKEIQLSEDTILVGHSLGCSFIMSLLERSEVSVKKAICVAGPYNKKRFGHLAFLQEQYDWEKIKRNCASFVFVHSTNDPWDCDEQEADFAFKELGGMKIIMKDQGHFGTLTHNQRYTEFSFLIKLIEAQEK